jgi:hypothetical protein
MLVLDSIQAMNALYLVIDDDDMMMDFSEQPVHKFV